MELKNLNIMTSKNIALILAVVVAILLLFRGNCDKPVRPEITPVKEQVKAVEKTEAAIAIPIDSIKFEIVIKDKKIGELSRALKFYQSENKRLGGLAVLVDTIYQATTISEYVDNVAIADSLCNENITVLETKVDDYQNLVDLKDSMYMELRQSFNYSIDQQKATLDYAIKLEKKVKRVQAGRWVWKAAAVVGGVFILQSVIK